MRGNLRNKLALMLATAALMVVRTIAVWAGEGSFWDDLKDAGSEIYQDVKEKAPEVYDAAKEKAGEAYDYVSEKAPELYDAAKEKAPEVYGAVKEKAGQAAEAVQEFRHDSEDEFWERFESQTGVKVDERTYTSGKKPETAASVAVETSEAPTESGQSEISIAPNDAVQAEPGTASIELTQNELSSTEQVQNEPIPTDPVSTEPEQAESVQSDEATDDNIFRLGSIVGGILLIVILLGCFLAERDIWRYKRRNQRRRR